MAIGDEGSKPIGGSPASVSPPSGPSAPSPAVPPAPASERLSPDLTPLPSGLADLEQLNAVLEGRSVATQYQNLLNLLSGIANRLPSGSYDFQQPSKNGTYHIFQKEAGSPIEVTFTQHTVATATPTPVKTKPFQLTYLPDGKIQSSLNPNAHTQPQRGPESSHHKILFEAILPDIGQRIKKGYDLYVRLKTSLESFRGRTTPETNSVWYDNFAVHVKSAFTFRRGYEKFSNPQLNQITILADTVSDAGAQRSEVATLSATGEINFSSNQSKREPLSHEQVKTLEGVVTYLEQALRDPKTYQKNLAADLIRLAGTQDLRIPEIERSVDTPREFTQGESVFKKSVGEVWHQPYPWIPEWFLRGVRRINSNWFKEVRPIMRVPEIARSVDIPREFGVTYGPQGESVFELKTVRQIWQHSHPGTPEWLRQVAQRYKPNWFKEVRPRSRLKFSMNGELFQWFRRSVGYYAFGRLRDPQRNAAERGDWMQLQLFPNGGGRLDIFRNGKRHDVIVGGERGPLWEARQEIKDMHGKVNTPTPFEDLQAAMARRSSGAPLPIALHLQRSPKINLDRLHLDADGSPIEIWDAKTAWRLIQQQMPEGIEARVESKIGVNFSEAIPRDEITHIKVDLSHYHPPLRLEISHHDNPEGSGTVRKVEAIMHSGLDTVVGVWQNGKIRPDIAKDTLHHELARARTGQVPRNLTTLGLQSPLKIYGFYKFNGGTFAFGYFFSLPFILGIEHLVYNKEQQKILGTPLPEMNLKSIVQYAKHDIVVPFMFMSTSSGIASNLVDGAFNATPGLIRAARYWESIPNMTLSKAFRQSGISFYNPNPTVRPLGGLFKGFCQRAIPLFAGLAAIGYWKHGRINTPTFWQNARDVGGVSAGSSVLVRALMGSDTLSAWAARRGYFKAAESAAESRFSVTAKGGLYIAMLEMLVLGAINTYEKLALLKESKIALGKELANTIDRRNELLTRLEHGEEMSPQQLMGADQQLIQAQSAYRKFLEISEKYKGENHYEPLTLANDFQDEYAALSIAQNLNDPMARVNMKIEHEQRLTQLRSRENKMEQDLASLYESHGIPQETPPLKQESLRDFLSHRINMLKDNPEMLSQGVDAAQESLSLVTPGSHEVMESSSAPTQENDKEANSKMTEFMTAEIEIRKGYQSTHSHIKEHTKLLADNMEDFDLQMADYLRRTNERIARALDLYIDPAVSAEPVSATNANKDRISVLQ